MIQRERLFDDLLELKQEMILKESGTNNTISNNNNNTNTNNNGTTEAEEWKIPDSNYVWSKSIVEKISKQLLEVSYHDPLFIPLWWNLYEYVIPLSINSHTLLTHFRFTISFHFIHYIYNI